MNGEDKLRDQTWNRIFLLGLLAAVLFVLWLPVFPTGDGPVHLYYADVLWSLVRHQPTYAHDYAIRHLFAPYLVHYLALIAFEHFVSPPMAEKLFIAIIFVVTATGFRSLARALGEQAPTACVPIACIWMLPLLFSWSLGGGFLNCCFATGVALWSFGIWTRLLRAAADRLAWLLAAYALSLGLLVLSHPVPLLVLLLFTASDLLLQLVSGASGWRVKLPQAIAFVLSCVAFVAPVLLAQKGQAAAVLPGVGFHLYLFWEMLLGIRLGYFAGLSVHSWIGWLALLARLGLVQTVFGVAFLLLRGNAAQAPHLPWHRRLLADPARRLLLITLLFLFATLFFPLSLNNSFFFPQRMWDICWLLVLACGAAATPSLRTRQRLGWAGLALIALIAVTGLPALVRIARAQQQLAAAPLPAGGRGLFLEPDSAVQGWGAETTYPVFYWAGARAFAASHAVLLNSPWLGLTILPVRDAPGAPGPAALLDRGLPSMLSESPPELTRTLAGRSPDRDTILARANFLLYSNPASLGSPQEEQQTLTAALALLGPESAAWHCEARAFYAICLHTR